MIFFFRGGGGAGRWCFGACKGDSAKTFFGDVIAGGGPPFSLAFSVFLSLLSVKQHFGKTSWACHFQNPIWADFPWNPSISVGGIPFFLHFFLLFALVWVVGPF